ncbi:MAG: hypothetical protein DI547_06400 [Sphingobium sp.]|nr:MAG: hypothetical protein DI547_06400 [Sphingobium sp.]
MSRRLAKPFAATGNDADISAVAHTLRTEFGAASLTLARQMLSTAEGEARTNWQKVVMELNEEAAG